MITEEMKSLVKIEAKKLKRFATKEELSHLDFDRFDPNYTASCIYGLMTDYCHSERAQELIKKCCDKVYKASAERVEECTMLNGKPQKRITGDGGNKQVTYWSPIEVFVAQHDNDANAKLIGYLKSETKTLEF